MWHISQCHVKHVSVYRNILKVDEGTFCHSVTCLNQESTKYECVCTVIVSGIAVGSFHMLLFDVGFFYTHAETLKFSCSHFNPIHFFLNNSHVFFIFAKKKPETFPRIFHAPQDTFSPHLVSASAYQEGVLRIRDNTVVIELNVAYFMAKSFQLISYADYDAIIELVYFYNVSRFFCWKSMFSQNKVTSHSENYSIWHCVTLVKVHF